MPRRKRWEYSPVLNGTVEVRLLSWGYFHDYVYRELLEYESYIWRGHRRDDWVLEPTLDRLIKNQKALTPVKSFRPQHLDRFKYAARGRRGPNPPHLQGESDWWALGQHHGLATPLLDWTTSPFVAAYFAFVEKRGSQTKHRVVYALHRPSIEKKVRELKLLEIDKREQEKRAAEGAQNVLLKVLLDRPIRDQVEFIRPLSDENPSLVSQNGLFTRSPDGISLEEWIRKNFHGEQHYLLIKILIPTKDRGRCLKTLNRMNINHLTLFPDLYGASKYCNVYAEFDGY